MRIDHDDPDLANEIAAEGESHRAELAAEFEATARAGAAAHVALDERNATTCACCKEEGGVLEPLPGTRLFGCADSKACAARIRLKARPPRTPWPERTDLIGAFVSAELWSAQQALKFLKRDGEPAVLRAVATYFNTPDSAERDELGRVLKNLSHHMANAKEQSK